MFKTHSWRTASLVMALTAMVGLALPAFGDDGRPFRGHVDEVLPVPRRSTMIAWLVAR